MDRRRREAIGQVGGFVGGRGPSSCGFRWHGEYCYLAKLTIWTISLAWLTKTQPRAYGKRPRSRTAWRDAQMPDLSHSRIRQIAAVGREGPGARPSHEDQPARRC